MTTEHDTTKAEALERIRELREGYEAAGSRWSVAALDFLTRTAMEGLGPKMERRGYHRRTWQSWKQRRAVLPKHWDLIADVMDDARITVEAITDALFTIRHIGLEDLEKREADPHKDPEELRLFVDRHRRNLEGLNASWDDTFNRNDPPEPDGGGEDLTVKTTGGDIPEEAQNGPE